MKARPEFFSWSAEEQERFGVGMPKEDRARLDQALLAQLFARLVSSQSHESLLSTGGFAGILRAIHRLEVADLHSLYPLARVQAERDHRRRG